MTATEPWILPLDAVAATDLRRVGGKGANLGVLAAAGLPVPPGFCVTTDAFHAFLGGDPVFAALLAEAEALPTGDLPAVRDLGERLRAHVASRPLPDAVADAVRVALRAQGPDAAWAVRSSATAEDLPTASFAGQQDTYLNVRGEDAVVEGVRACMGSLFTDRAILYRQQNRIPQAQVALSVVVQAMVQPEAAGILFTADPRTGHRGRITIDAGFGLGEALVSGLVSADLYVLDKASGELLEVTVGDKALAIRSLPGGGTVREELRGPDRQARVLTDEQARRLAELGARIEALQGSPQDIEWCFAGGEPWVVQSRPITSLFPLAEPGPPPGELGVHVSFSHFQVMTDPMPPLASDVWRLLMPFGQPVRATRTPMLSPWSSTAGGRIYIDMAPILRQPRLARVLLKVIVNADPLAASALRDVVDRAEFRPGRRVSLRGFLGAMGPKMAAMQATLWLRDPEKVRAWGLRLMDELRTSTLRAIAEAPDRPAALRTAWIRLGGFFMPLFEFPPSVIAGYLAGYIASRLADLSPQQRASLGRGLRGNVTTEMDLALGDLADALRPLSEVGAALRSGVTDRAALEALPGGEEFGAALGGFLDRYGARAAGEIDLSRARWAEDPSPLLGMLAGLLHHDEPGLHRAHHRRMEEEGEAVAALAVQRAGRGPLGFVKRRVVARLVRVHRVLAAMREHPKWTLINTLAEVRRLFVAEGRALAEQGRLAEPGDVWFLRFEELMDAAEGRGGDLLARTAERRAAHERYGRMAAPRAFTSDGEIPVGRHELADLPEGALAGSPASSGVVEGRARVVRDPAGEVLKRGEILVAPFTDPGWTPLFLNAGGLVMEVGGLMTHGSVVAREYGIPAVVCLPDATKVIRDGQLVRVDGDRGFVQLLEP